ncbi:MAG: hypothetical protein JW965_08825 [Bacteroidales bacterium]|nr:hypothetical protein [Bacteroidales bacterium]
MQIQYISISISFKLISIKKAILFISVIIICSSGSRLQQYPFQVTGLTDEEGLDNLISLMTLDEKIDHLSSRLPGIPRLGVQRTRFVEGLARMWDPELHEKIAAWEAYETRYLTQNKDFASAGLILLAPNADLGRDIRWGRTEECYGEDACLASVL